MTGAAAASPWAEALLALTAATVDSHVEHTLDKLDLNNRAQIAAWVAKQPSTIAHAAQPTTPNVDPRPATSS